MNFNQDLTKRLEYIEDVLDQYKYRTGEINQVIAEAMNYSLEAGGKRLRPMMMKEVYDSLGGTGKVVEPFMAAMEMIHTYSLVHDDLPCMDNDDYRRGKLTTHKKFGEAMGTLAGDGLLNFAFETAFKAFDYEDDKCNIPLALKVLGEKAGPSGMIGGQVVDVTKVGEPLTKHEIMYIYENKTCRLIEASMMIGGILAGASSAQVKNIEKAAYAVGMAFQIQDDILDMVGDEAVIGKPVGSDERNQKTTYITLSGIEKAKKDVEDYSMRAVEVLKLAGVKSEFLEKLIITLINREK